LEESFVNLLGEEAFYILPKLVEKINEKIPKEFTFLNVEISKIGLTDFAINTDRANFDIDNQKRGFKITWPTLKTWNIHFHVRVNYLFIFHYSMDVDIKMRDILLDNGLSIKANEISGAPIISLFDTHIDLGKSDIDLSGNLAVWVINWFTSFFKLPLQIVINEFFEPVTNLVISWFIVPVLL
jgi:hypothetical protein